MNKQELTQFVSVKGKMSFAAAGRAVDLVLNGVRSGLVQDDEVKLSGFGTFSVRNLRARHGRNPQTGEPIQIQASDTVAFRVSQQLKEAVRDYAA